MAIHDVQLAVGDICEDTTGLRVRVDEIDLHNRVHFSVVGDDHEQNAVRGEMSRQAFSQRFFRMYSARRTAA